MSDGQAMPEVDRPLPGLDAGIISAIISALPFLIEIDVERIDVIRAEPKLPAKFSLHVLVFRLLREDSSLGPALFGLEVEVVVMQQAVRPLLGRHLVAVGDISSTSISISTLRRGFAIRNQTRQMSRCFQLALISAALTSG